MALLNAQDDKAFTNNFPEAESLAVSKNIQRLSWDTNIGSSFFYSKAFGSGTEFFAAPQLNYGISPRLSLHGGVMFSYTSFFGHSSLAENNRSMINTFPGMSVYGSASYQLNENITFYGTGVRHMSSFFSEDMPAFMNNSYNSFSIGSSFRLGDNVTIGASIHVNDRNKYNSPFSQPATGRHYSPFYW